MGADPLIYCLEHVTDYDQFERLSHDLMALSGYRDIEPLGGMKDKGRDALHTARDGTVRTIFAYSVREDWQKKLDEDANKIRSHRHPIDRLVVLGTSYFTPTERDNAVRDVKNSYGWDLDLFGLERLGVMLRTTHEAVVAKHPHIFCPPFFPAAGGLSLSPSHDHVVLDHVDADAHVAHWLARRLALLGYRVWCRGLAPIAGSSSDGTVRALIQSRAFRYVCLWSAASVVDPDFSSRRQLAQLVGQQRGGGSIIIPAQVGDFDKSRLDGDARTLEAARFDDSYARGLKQIEDALAAAGCPRNTGVARDAVLRSLEPPNIVKPVTERLASNIFRVRRFPEVIRRYQSTLPLAEYDPYLEQWGFRRIGATEALSLHRPSADIVNRFGLEQREAFTLSAAKDVRGIKVRDLVTELIKKSIVGACLRLGMVYRADRRLVYVPTGLLEGQRLNYRRLDGKPNYFLVTGERSHGRGENATKFRHHLAPSFVVKGSPWRGYEVVLRIRVHLTDAAGGEFPGKVLNARRKKLCKNWWNDKWLARTLGTMQFLANENGLIVIGSQADERLEIESTPRLFDVPCLLDESALGEPDDEITDDHPFELGDEGELDDEDE